MTTARRYCLQVISRSTILAVIGFGLLTGLPVDSWSGDDLPSNLSTANEPLIVRQRNVFREIYADVERGNWQKAEQHEELLQSYVLWPDLQATYYRARLVDADDSEIRAFLDQYGVLKPARELRYRYALHLAGEERLDEYFDIYQQYYQGLELAKLDCLALQAEIEQGRQKRVINRARNLWLVGKSQEDECEPVFDVLRDENLINNDHYKQRFTLAVDAKKFSLAKYLARSLGDSFISQANAWLQAHSKPKVFLDAADRVKNDNSGRRQLTYAVGRVALYEPLLAQEYWNSLSGKFTFSVQQSNDVLRHIALWAAREHLPEAHSMLTALPPAAVDAEAGGWLVRTNLLRRDWNAVVDSIDALPDEEYQKPEWQFWKAIAHEETGQIDSSISILQKMATERSYYGFLAADAIAAPYAFDHSPSDDDNDLATELANVPELIRARELYLVGLDGRGRSEWDAAVRSMSRDKKMQAAILAHRWGWHSRAISTLANAGSFDDLEIRYPLPWRSDFEQHSRTVDIPHSWAYGIARSESLFMRDIQSSAGAIGLMQLMPATGRETAAEIQLRYGGRTTLTDSSSNIRLGTAYLSKMSGRFDGHHALATAAYNAGPHRVEKWLRSKDDLDARIWIENIPYRETRNYVRRVLTDEAIFHWRLTGEHKRISSELPNIDESSDSMQIASSH